MNRLIWLTVAVGIPLAGLFFGGAQAQTGTTPKPPPTSAVYPFANPVLSAYQRDRELRTQRALERNIQDLQRLEVLKAKSAKAADPLATDAASEQKPAAKPSVSYKADSPITKKPAGAKTAETVVEPKRKVEAAEPKKGASFSKTFSNYNSLLKKN